MMTIFLNLVAQSCIRLSWKQSTVPPVPNLQNTLLGYFKFSPQQPVFPNCNNDNKMNVSRGSTITIKSTFGTWTLTFSEFAQPAVQSLWLPSLLQNLPSSPPPRSLGSRAPPAGGPGLHPEENTNCHICG